MRSRENLERLRATYVTFLGFCDLARAVEEADLLDLGDCLITRGTGGQTKILSDQPPRTPPGLKEEEELDVEEEEEPDDGP